mmetsp:Transcript_31374/g.37350  ORF Transcript_31374/g.37350 Transcript_31374/m.37350 type:complete len:133 (+) Transcript_31374:231-629(+)
MLSFDGIKKNAFSPSGYRIRVSDVDDQVDVGSAVPLTLGNQNSVELLATTNLCTQDGRYTVATSAPKYRFKKSCGMGFTLMNESLVLMNPDIEQYMVGMDGRKPDPSHRGFLCCRSMVLRRMHSHRRVIESE